MRVVAGEFGGRRLKTPRGDATRPTSERARAGLFDWLGAHVEDARVLDLYAGTGALGIEALSRGARSAVFVEHARAPCALLRENLRALGVGGARVLQQRVEAALTRLARGTDRFDLILADPPYRDLQGDRMASSALGIDPGKLRTLMAPHAVFVCERTRRAEAFVAEPVLVRTQSKRYGETVFDRFERFEQAEDEQRPESK